MTKEQKALLENWEDRVDDYGFELSVGDRNGLLELVWNIVEAKDAEWRNKLEKLAEECTTDLGTTDFEMFAEKVFKLLAEDDE